jgi:type IV secretory pathway VirB2 component (pilin)
MSSKLSVRKKLGFFALAAIVCATLVTVAVAQPTFADCKTGVLPQTWCDGDGSKSGIEVMLEDLVWIIGSIAGVIAVPFIAMAGFTWMTATDDPGKVQAAKKRILEIVVGLIVYVFIGLIVTWLIPG